MSRGNSLSSSSKWRLTVVSSVAAALSGLTAGVAQADHYMKVDLLGRIQGSGQPFASSVNVGVGSVVEYAVQFELAPEGAINEQANAIQPGLRTITNWVPSNGATSPTAGLNNLRFSLSQQNAPGTTQVDFDGAGAQPTTTGGGTWGSSAFSPGTITPRGNGNDDLLDVRLFRAAGNYDGIAANPTPPPDELPEQLIVATGLFTVTAVGNPLTSYVQIGTQGLALVDIIAFYRWRNADNTLNVNYQETVTNQNNSLAASDPLIRYSPLALPEPGGVLVVLGLGAAAGLRCRRRRAV